MTPLEILVVAVWAMLPAYVPNNVAVLVGGGRPIDGGRIWNGARLLGDGKTWRGTVGGIAVGAALGLALNALAPGLPGTWATVVPTFPVLALLALPAGAMVGDIAASFAKRRTGRARGAAFPVVDQLDFVVGALAAVFALAPEWTLATFTLPVLAVVLVLTPLLHVGTNVGAYLLGLKDEPW